MNERRTRRSQDPYRALCLQLEHSRSQGQLDAVVIAIDNGLLVAGAGERSVCPDCHNLLGGFGSGGSRGGGALVDRVVSRATRRVAAATPDVAQYGQRPSRFCPAGRPDPADDRDQDDVTTPVGC